MGDTAVLYGVWVRLREPRHADGHQPLGDINGEDATLPGNAVKYEFDTDPPGALVRLVTLNTQPHLPLLGGAA
jgi:hypothetical protein